jgi:hypothetical protein
MSGFVIFSGSVAIVCYVILLQLLLRSHLKSYLILFINLLVLLFTCVIDFGLYFGAGARGFSSDQVRLVYYSNDLIRQAMVYLLVISLILSAVRGSERFRWLGRWLVLGAALLALLFAVVHRDDRLALWMTNVIRNLSLVAMLMNLLLWVLLMKKRTADRTLLLVTTGLGLQMAGEAMGQSLRLIGASTTALGNVVLVLAHLSCLLVWFLAFKPRKQSQRAA